MEKEVILGSGKKIPIKEIKYKDLVLLEGIPKDQVAKKILQLATSLTDEEYDSLNLKDGVKIQKEINSVNGLGEDFQKSLE